MTYFLKNNYFIFVSSLVFLSLSVFLIWIDLFWLCLFPIGLLGVYSAIYHTRLVFLSLAFLTPLSVNIEEYTNGLGLFLPTEPFFFGLMLLILFFEFRKRTIPKEILNALSRNTNSANNFEDAYKIEGVDISREEYKKRKA